MLKDLKKTRSEERLEFYPEKGGVKQHLVNLKKYRKD